MEFSFPWPVSRGEWLAWASAAATLLFGVALMFAPRLLLRLLRLRTVETHPEAVAEARATMGGFHVGLSLTCLLFAQPFLYMALGFSWAFAAFGRMVSMMSDRGATMYNWAALLLSIALAALPLAYVLGFVP